MEGRTRQSKIFRIASGRVNGAEKAHAHRQGAHTRTSTKDTLLRSSAHAYLRGRPSSHFCRIPFCGKRSASQPNSKKNLQVCSDHLRQDALFRISGSVNASRFTYCSAQLKGANIFTTKKCLRPAKHQANSSRLEVAAKCLTACRPFGPNIFGFHTTLTEVKRTAYLSALFVELLRARRPRSQGRFSRHFQSLFRKLQSAAASAVDELVCEITHGRLIPALCRKLNR